MRKLISGILIVVLLVSVMSAGFAATTVGTAMYGEDKAPGLNMPVETITSELKDAGITDVKPTDWSAGSITVLVKEGLIAPEANGSIKPNALMTEKAFVVVLAKIMGLAEKTDTAEKALQKAQEAGLVQNTDSSQQVTRLEVARLLATALGIKPKLSKSTELKQYITDASGMSLEDSAILASLYELGIFKGYPDKTFRPDQILTKAQMAVLIDKILGAQVK
jgi:hypothetical protein